MTGKTCNFFGSEILIVDRVGDMSDSFIVNKPCVPWRLGSWKPWWRWWFWRL